MYTIVKTVIGDFEHVEYHCNWCEYVTTNEWLAKYHHKVKHQ